MQDRYVGDVGDFAKYALLRRVSGRGAERRLQIGVVWCLFPNEAHNADGRHISYLDKETFAGLDDELLAAMRRLVRTGRRSVRAIADIGVLPLESVFCEDTVPHAAGRQPSARRLSGRSAWLEMCLEKTKDCDLVFFDPDNGIETASIGKAHRKAGKYIFWDELGPFWARGQALLIYHHLNRTKSAVRQVEELRVRLKEEFSGSAVTPLIFRRGSLRVFWLVCPAGATATELKRRAGEFEEERWARHFRASPPDEI